MNTPGDAVDRVLRRFFANEIQAAEAAAQLDALGAEWIMFRPGSLSPDQESRMPELDAARGALKWERAKQRHPSLPDVPYGSAEYEAFWKSVPRSSDEDPEPDLESGGTA